MKHKNIYKTPEECIVAFNNFCKSVSHCDDCMLHDFVDKEGQGMCILKWLELEPKSSGELIMQLVQNLRNLNFEETVYDCVADIVSETRREQIKAIWAKQDEEAKKAKEAKETK